MNNESNNEKIKIKPNALNIIFNTVFYISFLAMFIFSINAENIFYKEQIIEPSIIAEVSDICKSKQLKNTDRRITYNIDNYIVCVDDTGKDYVLELPYNIYNIVKIGDTVEISTILKTNRITNEEFKKNEFIGIVDT